MTQWHPGMAVTAERLMDGLAPTTTTAGLIVASGWTLNDFQAERSGRAHTLDMYIHRSGTTLSPGGDGNLGDTDICTVPDGWAPLRGINSCWDDGFVEGGWYINTAGLCALRTATGDIVGDATSPGNGRNLRLHLAYIKA